MFGGGEKRKGFVRTEVSGTERAISWVILLVLIAAGAGIYLKGQSYDPALFSLDPELLSESAGPQREQVRLTEPSESSALSVLADVAPEGWHALGDVEHFSADDLYEKIDGRAEQYLAYDVVGMACVSLADASDRFIDVYIYDMGAPINAFGIYSVERAEGQPAVDLGRGGYRAAASIFYWTGAYYVQVVAAGRDDALVRAGQQVADTLASRLADTGEDVWGLSAFPEERLVAGSIQYFKRDALSLDFLKDTFTARYDYDGRAVTAFLSRQPSAGAAARTLDSYQAYLADYGQLLDRGPSGSGQRLVGDMGGFYDVVYQSKDWIGGVTMAQDRALAEKAAADLMSRDR